MRTIALGLVLALASCSVTAPPAKGPPPAKGAPPAKPATAAPAAAAPRVPADHRAQAPGCPRTRGPGSASEPRGDCKTDGDCKKGSNGRCVRQYGGGRMPPSNECSYDACFADGDCGKDALCLCGHGDKEAGDGHGCLAASCRSDGDCGAGGFCSPSASLCSRRGGPSRYYCHSRSDECVDDSDCPRSERKGYGPMATGCVYSPELGHWACATEECPVG